MLEGICLRSVLRPLPIKLTVSIYVKYVSDMGLWHDGLHLEDFAHGEFMDGDRKETHLSDFLYHVRYQPHQAADFIIERRENDESGLTSRPTRTPRRWAARRRLAPR